MPLYRESCRLRALVVGVIVLLAGHDPHHCERLPIDEPGFHGGLPFRHHGPSHCAWLCADLLQRRGYSFQGLDALLLGGAGFTEKSGSLRAGHLGLNRGAGRRWRRGTHLSLCPARSARSWGAMGPLHARRPRAIGGR